MPPYSNMDHSQSFGDSGYGGGGSSSLTNNPPQQRQPLHHQLHKSTSNVETRHGLVHLAALELEAMRSPPSSPPSSSLNNRKSSNNDNDTASQCSGGRTKSDKRPSRGGGIQIIQEEIERSFPPACLTLLQSLPNNTRCHDCQNPSLPASWASVSYGITLCLHCSGKHRSLGVNCSFIKSLTLDSWKRKEILCMLEGGNEQLSTFFERHGMGGSANNNGSTTASSSRRESTGSSSSDDGSTSSVGILDRYKTKAASFYRQHLLNHARVISEKEGMYEGREASRQRQQQQQHQSKGNKSKSSKSSSGSSSRKKSRGGVVEQKKKKLASSSLPTVTEKE